MLSKLIVSALLALGLVTAHAGIDLTPNKTEYVAEGVKFQLLTFQDDKHQIEYEPPRNWSFDGGTTELRLKPPKSFAEAVISATPTAKSQSLDATAIKQLEEQVMAGLPSGSQFVKIEQEIENGVLLSGNNTFEITVSYQVMGEKFSRSTLFANIPGTQLIFRLTSRKDDFVSLHQDFQSSIFSWHYAVAVQEQKASAAPASAN